MKPSVWGPHFWYILHIITFNYPLNPSEYHKRAYHDFFTNLKDVIPCEDCQKHYTKHIQEYPIGPHLDNRGNLVKWLIQIHNFANLSLGKPAYTPEEVLYIYSKVKAISPFIEVDETQILQKKTHEKNKGMLYILIIAFLAIAFTMKMRYRYNYYNY
jgi:hypothetical protein